MADSVERLFAKAEQRANETVKKTSYGREYDYAVQIRWNLHCYRKAKEVGDWEYAAYIAARLGDIVTESDMADDSARGIKVSEGGLEGAKAEYGDEEAREARRAQLRQAYEEARANGAKSKHAACKVVEKQFGVSYKTVERALK